MKILGFFIVFISLVQFIENAKILAVFPLPGSSHFIMFERVLKGLAQKGHEVDVVSHFPLKQPLPGYNDLSIRGSQPILVNNLTVNQMQFTQQYSMMHFMIGPCGVTTCELAFKTPVLQKLKNTTKKYDLLITEAFSSDCMVGFAHLFKIPFVSFTSSVHLSWNSDRIGLPDNPSYIPTYFVNSGAKMTLSERLYNVYVLVLSKLMYKFKSYPETDQVARDFFGPDLPSTEDMVYNTSILFVNSHFSANPPRPAVPGFVEIGGVHIEHPKPLPKKFEDILTTNINKGVIFFSMGSLIKSDSFPLHKIQALFDAFSELPYKILWKGEREHYKSLTIPKNIHFEKWIPQLDLLCHPSIKLFVSHGGLMGSQEAIYCGVPRLGIPLFADQDLNIRESERMGLAIRVSYDNISKDNILNAAKELLSNPKYKSNAKRIAQIFKDRPMSPLDTAIYWIEYVIRYNGAPHLRSAATELAWYQYYMLDIALILLSTLLLIFYIIKTFVKLVIAPAKKFKQQ